MEAVTTTQVFDITLVGDSRKVPLVPGVVIVFEDVILGIHKVI
jgi:hypothetical protein